MDRAAARHEPLDDLVEEAADDLHGARLVVARHERSDKAARRHATETVAALDKQHARAVPRGGYCGAHACRSAAGNQHVGLVGGGSLDGRGDRDRRNRGDRDCRHGRAFEETPSSKIHFTSFLLPLAWQRKV